MVQKAVVAGIPMIVAVGAPTSLAVDIALRFGITLVGFLRGSSMNVYSHPARIDREEPGSVMDTFEQVMKEDRMGFAGIRTPKQNHIRIFDLLVGIRSAAHSKNRRQTDDAWSMSGSIATIDVVRTDHDPDELLGGEVHLVGGFGATENAKRLRFGPGGGKPLGRAIERFVPGSGSQRPVFTDQGLCQPRTGAA